MIDVSAGTLLATEIVNAMHAALDERVRSALDKATIRFGDLLEPLTRAAFNVLVSKDSHFILNYLAQLEARTLLTRLKHKQTIHEAMNNSKVLRPPFKP